MITRVPPLHPKNHWNANTGSSPAPKFASGIARHPTNCWRNSRARASEPGDEALIDKVLVLHKDYLLAIDHMFAAVDAGDMTLANKIDGAEVDPRFDAMESLVIAASDSHHVEAFLRLDELAFVQKSVLAATPLVFAIGIALVVLFSRVLRAQRRREAQAMKHEATAVSRSEKRFRALVQNASDVVLICTAEGTVTYQSPTAETKWGYAAGGLLRKSLLAAVHPDDQPAFQELLVQLHRLTQPGAVRRSFGAGPRPVRPPAGQRRCSVCRPR